MDEDRLAMRDILDGQLEAEDGREIGRVDDVVVEWRADGSLVLTRLVTGPQALAGRLSSRLRSAARFLLRDRFDHEIAVDQITEIGPTVKLRGKAVDYAPGRTDQWIVDHLVRFIPGHDH